MEAAPEIYFETDHYAGWPAVLARAAAISDAELVHRIERAWRVQAPKNLWPNTTVRPRRNQSQKKRSAVVSAPPLLLGSLARRIAGVARGLLLGQQLFMLLCFFGLEPPP